MGLFSTKTTQKSEPWAPAQPYLKDLLPTAQKTFDRFSELNPQQRQAVDQSAGYLSDRLGGRTGQAVDDAAYGLLTGAGRPQINPVQYQGIEQPMVRTQYITDTPQSSPTAARAAQGALDPTAALSKVLSGQVDNPQLARMAEAATRQGQRSYLDAVEDSTTALTEDILPQVRSGAIAAGGYGGSRQGIAEGRALSERERMLGRGARDLGIAAGDATANLYGNAYEAAQGRMASIADSLDARAMQMAENNTDRRLDVSKFNVGNDFQASRDNAEMSFRTQDANLGRMADIGFTNNQQAMDKARLDAGLLGQGADMWAQGGADRRADISSLLGVLGYEPAQAMEALKSYGGIVSNVGQQGGTTTAKQGGSVLGGLGGILGGLGSLAGGLGMAGLAFSDRRLKEDIETVGRDAAGRRLVTYRYKGEPDDVRRVGHIAQEVQKTDPHAVRKVGKHLAIDYGLLGDVA